MTNKDNALPWLEEGQAFPSVEQALGPDSDAPGLLAAGGSLDTETLLRAYRSGIFPWFSRKQPILWWSPTPRMVLRPQDFRVHRSFKKTLNALRAQGPDSGFVLRFDSAFGAVIRACAQTPRSGQNGGQSGTWIVPAMIEAYEALHHAGYAHSAECWHHGQLVGGLYFVAIGHAVYGESMFSHQSNASKLALALLVSVCKAHGIAAIDCQQQTEHLHSLGARPQDRQLWLQGVGEACTHAPIAWARESLYWDQLLPARVSASPNTLSPSE